MNAPQSSRNSALIAELKQLESAEAFLDYFALPGNERYQAWRWFVTGFHDKCKTPLDECGRVYKDLDAVLAVLEQEQIAKVAHRLYPVANMKGMD